MSEDEDVFVWTDEMTRTVQWISFFPAATGIFIAIVVLIFAAALYWRPETRNVVKRSSFTLVLIIQVVNILHLSTYIAGVAITSPSKACQPLMIMSLFNGAFQSAIIAAIAINLQLVVVHGLNTRSFVRWYIVGSVLFTLAVVLPGAIKGAWGWDPLSFTCWIAVTDPKQRDTWVLGTIWTPAFVITAICLFSTAAVLWRLLSFDRITRNVFSGSADLPDSSQNLFRRVALHIVWYPLLQIIVTVPATAADVAVSKSGGINSKGDYRLWCASAFLLAARPLFQGIVTLLVDPAFSSAIRARLLRCTPRSSAQQRSTIAPIEFRQRETVDVELNSFGLGPTSQNSQGSVSEPSKPPGLDEAGESSPSKVDLSDHHSVKPGPEQHHGFDTPSPPRTRMLGVAPSSSIQRSTSSVYSL